MTEVNAKNLQTGGDTFPHESGEDLSITCFQDMSKQ